MWFLWITLLLLEVLQNLAKEVFTVEVDLPGEAFGDIVIAEYHGKSKMI